MRLRLRWLIVALAVLGGLGASLWAPLTAHSSAIILVGLEEEPVTLQTSDRQLGAALRSAGIPIGPKDYLSPPPETALKRKGELTVHLRRAVAASVIVDGTTVKAETTAISVSALLRELGIETGPMDLISVDPEVEPTPGMQIQVVRRTEKVTRLREEIPFRTVRRADRNMLAGEVQEIQVGLPGIREIEQVIHLEDGLQVAVVTLSEQVLQDPVDEVIAYGTAGVVSRSGESFRYVQELSMEATGYTAGPESNPNGTGHTYTGIKAVRGVVAVDPRVIPLHTRLYVEGYGPAIAADIGGAIKGMKIDLVFDTVAEALQWGRRPVTVYILGD
jgi:3D (Asp-Asp-Asp) domain-containing protein